MLISVIIPAYNEEEFIRDTLERINGAFEENRGKGFSWEIVVCDNHSTDKTADLATEMGTRVVFEPVNHISRARNTGAQAAKGEWLLFIDADSYPSPALLEETFDVIGSKKYIGCGVTVSVEDGTLFNKLRIERLNPIFRLLKLCGGAFLLCEAEAFRVIGGFSTDLYAYEEIDFVHRLKKYGRKNGKKFTVLYRHPLITSGRKGEYTLATWGVLIVSNLAAFIFYFLRFVLPKKVIKKIGTNLLGYWYKKRKG